jgi:hypothetical protein
MEKFNNFKPLIEPKTIKPSTKGDTLPVNKDGLVSGLERANANGEATTRKTIRNVKGAGALPKNRDEAFYKDYKFIEIDNKVKIVVKPTYEGEINNYTDFINLTKSTKHPNVIVDILPPIYKLHYDIIADDKLRFKVGDKVVVNFKYRSTIELKAVLEKKPVTITKIKFSNLKNMSVIIAYTSNGNFYPINEIEHYDRN